MIKTGLNNNQLKLIAMLTMTVDHVGILLLPQWAVLRLIGRLALPIYGYMIAEGCRHTSGMPKYLGSIAGMALVCQVVYWVALGSLYQCILVTFSLSVALIWLVKLAMTKKTPALWVAVAAAVAAVFVITQVLPQVLRGTDFAVDYGFFGVLLPVVIYLADTKPRKLLAAAGMLSLIALDAWQGQWAALLALPLLWLYNGRRGKMNLKWIFYFYYPVHLLVIQGISML